MTTRNWVGGTHDIADPSAWSPAGAPQPGDTAVIANNQSGPNNATASYQLLNGYTIDVTQRVDYPGAIPPTLDVTSTVLGPDQVVQGQPNTSGVFGMVQFVGSNVNEGSITAGALNQMDINIADVTGPGGVVITAGSLLNTGLIAAAYEGSSDVLITGQSPDTQLINDGTLDAFGTLDANVAVTGTGYVAVYSPVNGGYNGHLIFADGVSAGQTIDFAYQSAASDGVPYQPLMVLDDPQQFYGVVENFAQGAMIELAHTTATSDSYANGVLTLYGTSGVVANLKFAGTYTASQFQLASDGAGDTLLTVTGTPGAGAGGSGADTGNLAIPTPATSPLPQTGSVVLTTGDWTAADQTIGSTIRMDGTAAATAPSADVSGVAIAGNASITVADQTAPTPLASYGSVAFVGSNENDGSLRAGAEGNLAISIGDIATPNGLAGAVTINPGSLLNNGTIAASSSGTVGITGTASDDTLINDGSIVANGGGTLTVDVAVSGSGAVVVGNDAQGAPATVTFDSSVAAGQAVDFDGGTLRLDNPETFAATVANFGGANDSIILVGQTVTSDSYANGTLTLLNGSSLVGRLSFAGTYATDDFQVTGSGGNTVIRAPDTVASVQTAMAAANSAPDLASAGATSGIASPPSAGAVAEQVASAAGFGSTYADLTHQPPVVVPSHTPG